MSVAECPGVYTEDSNGDTIVIFFSNHPCHLVVVVNLMCILSPYFCLDRGVVSHVQPKPYFSTGVRSPIVNCWDGGALAHVMNPWLTHGSKNYLIS